MCLSRVQLECQPLCLLHARCSTAGCTPVADRQRRLCCARAWQGRLLYFYGLGLALSSNNDDHDEFKFEATLLSLYQEDFSAYTMKKFMDDYTTTRAARASEALTSPGRVPRQIVTQLSSTSSRAAASAARDHECDELDRVAALQRDFSLIKVKVRHLDRPAAPSLCGCDFIAWLAFRRVATCGQAMRMCRPHRPDGLLADRSNCARLQVLLVSLLNGFRDLTLMGVQAFGEDARATQLACHPACMHLIACDSSASWVQSDASETPCVLAFGERARVLHSLAPCHLARDSMMHTCTKACG